MQTTGRLSLLLAERKMRKQPITSIQALAKAADVPRYALDALNKNTPSTVIIRHVRSIAQVLELSTLALLFDLDPDVHRARMIQQEGDRPILSAGNEQGLSQREIARQLKMRRATLRKLDRGEAVYVNLEHLKQLLDLLKLSVDVVLRYTDSSNEPDKPTS